MISWGGGEERKQLLKRKNNNHNSSEYIYVYISYHRSNRELEGKEGGGDCWFGAKKKKCFFVCFLCMT